MSYTTPQGTPKFLVVGSKGWIGGMVADMLKAQGKDVTKSLARIEDRASLFA
jgi:nucleoside-diphosphate-sugar epimerase